MKRVEEVLEQIPYKPRKILGSDLLRWYNYQYNGINMNDSKSLLPNGELYAITYYLEKERLIERTEEKGKDESRFYYSRIPRGKKIFAEERTPEGLAEIVIA